MLVVIGAMKCGTTSLHHYLDRHPDIHMSRPKELDFFVEENNWKRGVEWYLSKFDPSAAVNGDASPNYTKYHLFAGVPERMHSVVPNARLIYVVRDPLKRLLSHFTHNIAAGRERGTIEDAFQDNVEENHYVLTSLYHRQLTKYFPYYPDDRILIIDADDLRSNRRTVLRRVFDYVEVDADFDHPRFDEERHDSSKKRRPTEFSRRLYELPGGRYLRYALRNVLDTEIEKPVLEGDLADRVREVLAKDADKLRAYSGQAFSGWSV